MLFSRTMICCLLTALAAVGCKAQKTADTAQSAITAQQARKIEVLVRTKFQVDPTVNVTLGKPVKSDWPGYRSLPVTFSDGSRSTIVHFLLSDDGKMLVRMEKFDLTGDPAAAIPTAGRPVRGAPNAKVEIVNFDDLECPYCAQFHAQLFPGIAERYKGLVKFVYKDYPLVQIHPWAMHAAVDANCLAQLNGAAYWNFVDYVHEHAGQISSSTHDPKQVFPILDKQALAEGEAAKVNQVKLAACVQKQDETPIQASLQEGSSLGVEGTPTFFVNGERVGGLTSTATLQKVIDRALEAAGVQPPPETAENHGPADAVTAAPAKH